MIDNKALINKIEDLEKQLGKLKIELKNPTHNAEKPDKLEIGDEVDILNTGENQGTIRTITKVNRETCRATVKTQKEVTKS